MGEDSTKGSEINTRTCNEKKLMGSSVNVVPDTSRSWQFSHFGHEMDRPVNNWKKKQQDNFCPSLRSQGISGVLWAVVCLTCIGLTVLQSFKVMRLEERVSSLEMKFQDQHQQMLTFLETHVNSLVEQVRE